MNKELFLSQGILYLTGILLAIISLFLYFLHSRRQAQIQHWEKSLNLQKHARIFHQLYQDANGFILSQHARQKRDAMEYAYGEIEFLSFIALLSLTNPDKKTVFYDLGSGIGKAVLACSMVYPVHKSVGVELFPELYLDACNRVAQLAKIKNYSGAAKKVELILGDFLDVNLNEATLVFINSTAFFGLTWEKLCAKLDCLSHLKTVITTSKALSCSNFSLVLRTKVTMSWGVVFAYIHTRKQHLTNHLENIE